MASKGHSKSEIAAKLSKANELASKGKLQSEIARTLGVSVMTLHRWRKAALVGADGGGSQHHQIVELELENARLRRLVTDLLLEKTMLEEALGKKTVA
jgi:transposase-like protein